MDFKEYVDQSESFTRELHDFLGKVGNSVFTSMKVVGERVSVKFPDYESLVSGVQRPMRFAAHHVHENVPKGKMVMNALRGMGVDPKKKYGWDDSQIQTLEKGITNKLSDIASDLGLLFELELFTYLVTDEKLHDMDEGSMEIPRVRMEYREKVQGKLGIGIFPLFEKVLHEHVAYVGKGLVARVKKLLGCAELIWFAGGSVSPGASRGSPADMFIGCPEAMGAGQGPVGTSLKFVSQTRIQIAQLGLESIAELLGGDVRSFDSAKGKGGKEWVVEMSSIMKDMISGDKDTIPAAKFTRIVNQLLTGGRDVIPVARHYASGTGGAEWSPNIRRDFTVTKDLSNPLKAKKGAKVTVRETAAYMGMSYELPKGEGTSKGTGVLFLPQLASGDVSVRMTQLTGERR